MNLKNRLKKLKLQFDVLAIEMGIRLHPLLMKLVE